MQVTSDPIILRGKVPGNKLVVLAGVHGNEPCGVKALLELVPTLEIEAGEVTFIFGNPAAIAANKRFIDSNLNRLFREDDLLEEREKNSLEYRRSRRLIPFLKNADALLDIHSSATPGSRPFVVCEPNSYAVAKHLPVDIISSGWDSVQPGGTDAFVNAAGGLGICIECGYNEDQESAEVAVQAICVFLSEMGAIRSTDKQQNSKTFLQVFELYKTKTNFKPAKEFKDFEKVTKSQLLGYDNVKRIKASEDSCILFVRQRTGPNEEAFLLAKEVTP